MRPRSASPPRTPGRIEREWRLGDIRDGLPQVYAATSELFVAQMLNLDLIGGISFGKGATPARRSSPAPNIWEGSSGVCPGCGFRRGMVDRSIAETCGRPDGASHRGRPAGGGFEALAVLSLDPGAADAESGAGQAIPAEELALPYRSAENPADTVVCRPWLVPAVAAGAFFSSSRGWRASCSPRSRSFGSYTSTAW